MVVQAQVGSAGTFDVKGAEISKGEHELAFGGAWQNGFRPNSDFVRQSYEVGYSYGFTDRFKAGIKLGGDRPVGGSFDFTAFGVETQFGILGQGSPIALSWYTGYDVGLLSAESEVLTFGPLIGFKAGRFDITLNPLFQKAWNPDAPGIDFAYAWQVKTGIADKIGLGVEGYGTVPDIGNAPGLDFQDHRMGPVVYIENDIANGVKSELQLGVLFGMTEATADTTGRAKFAIMW
jgi:hypothetical protein